MEDIQTDGGAKRLGGCLRPSRESADGSNRVYFALQVTLRQQVLNIRAHRFVHTAVDSITAQRHNGKNWKVERKRKRGGGGRGMSNEGWLRSAHSVFIEREEL